MQKGLFMDGDDEGSVLFRRWRSLDGRQHEAPSARRNGRTVLLFDAAAMEPAGQPEQDKAAELQEAVLFENLTAAECRTWEKLLAGWPVLKTARDEGVGHAAIYWRIHSMAQKNRLVRAWWQRRQAARKSHASTA